MRRSRRAWIVFALCAGLLLIAIFRVTVGTLDLEAEQVRARAEGDHAQKVSFALWRLEARLISILATEAARPKEHYTPFYSPTNILNNDENLSPLPVGKVLVASPLLSQAPEFVRLYVEISPDGNVTSPQVVSLGSNVQAPELQNVTAMNCQSWLNNSGAAQKLLNSALGGTQIPVAENNVQMLEPIQGQEANNAEANRQYMNRAASTREAQAPNYRHLTQLVTEVERGTLEPHWIADDPAGPELFLLRRVTTDKLVVLQGLWLDWPKLKETLLREIRDEIPDADLVPVLKPGQSQDAGRLLASIPAALVSCVPRVIPMSGISPARWTLLLGWVGVLVALLSVAFVLRAALQLGERRGRFVSAVTHELRTPLTTFQLYSQMLADGMVTEPAARDEYLATLRDESQRLARVVESVLLYARVEEGRYVARHEEMAIESLIERVLPALSQRAALGGMELCVEDEGPFKARVNVDAQAVEQILLNLVDNACKYAASSHDRRVHLEIRKVDSRIEFDLSDHGPGIASDERRLVFEPFERAPCHLAGSISGAGLGLSIARGIARGLDGNLELLPASQSGGASFRLTLPVIR